MSAYTRRSAEKYWASCRGTDRRWHINVLQNRFLTKFIRAWCPSPWSDLPSNSVHIPSQPAKIPSKVRRRHRLALQTLHPDVMNTVCRQRTSLRLKMLLHTLEIHSHAQ